MIRFDQVSKSFPVTGGRQVVLKPTSFNIETPINLGLVGRNGAGKSTMMRMIAGGMPPDAGTIERRGRFSWPLGFAGSFHRHLSGAENCTFVAGIYGVDADELRVFVNDFSELGRKFYEPFGTYSSGMRSRLAFGVSMGVAFDVYLIDEITAVGDARFNKKCRQHFEERMGKAHMIMISHQNNTIKSFCEAAMVLENGILVGPMSVDDALDLHRRNLENPTA